MASAAGTKTPETEGDVWDNFEDPSRCWIDLVEACRTGDPRNVNIVLQEAKRSQWTHALWDMAIAPAPGDLGDESSSDAEMEIGAGDLRELKKARFENEETERDNAKISKEEA